MVSEQTCGQSHTNVWLPKTREGSLGRYYTACGSQCQHLHPDSSPHQLHVCEQHPGALCAWRTTGIHALSAQVPQLGCYCYLIYRTKLKFRRPSPWPCRAWEGRSALCWEGSRQKPPLRLWHQGCGWSAVSRPSHSCHSSGEVIFHSMTSLVHVGHSPSQTFLQRFAPRFIHSETGELFGHRAVPCSPNGGRFSKNLGTHVLFLLLKFLYSWIGYREGNTNYYCLFYLFF